MIIYAVIKKFTILHICVSVLLVPDKNDKKTHLHS